MGSHLDPTWVAEHPAANFLAPSEIAESILAYVNTRQNEVLKSGGSLDPVRLRSNMLSSMPMCFNLFAPLRARPDVAVDLLRRGFGLDAVELIQIADIEGIECEWAPPPGAGIGDRTAFDAVVAYRDGDGQRCLLGVETKYTETFSPTEYGKPGDERQASRRAHYRRWTQAGWFRAGAEDRLYASATNQLWRNVMLAAACEELPGVDRASVAVVGLHRDPHAAAALRGVRSELLGPDRLVDVSLERILRLTATGELAGWSSAFKERYTDVLAVAEDDAVARDRLQNRLDELFPEGCHVAYDLGDDRPYELNCPHPVAKLVDTHLEVLLWREDNWSGDYPVGTVIEVAAGDDGEIEVELDGGRFVLSAVGDPILREQMRRRRLDAEEIALERRR